MCFILVFRFLQEVKAIAVGQKSQDRDYNHGVEIRQFFRPQKAAKDFQKTQGGEQQLEVAGQPGYFFLPQERAARSEEHTSELQSRPHLVCRLLLEKKKDDR